MLLFLLACAGPDPEDSGVDPVACVDTEGGICTWAGTGDAGFNGDGKALLDSFLYYPIDVTVPDNGLPVVLDWNNHKVRQVQADGSFQTIVGTDFVGDGPYDLSDLVAPGAPGETVNLNHPTDVDFFSDGTLLLASWHTHKLRSWDPATGLVMVVLGSGPGYAGDGATTAETLLNQPSKVAIADNDDVYFVDMRNSRVRVMRPDGTVDCVAGNGVYGFSGDGGDAVAAQVAFPQGANPEVGGDVAFGPDGRLYISDTENHRIRVVDLETGLIDTWAGTGDPSYGGDGGPKEAASFQYPRDIEINADGQMLIADSGNHRVRVIDMATGLVETLAGNGEAGFSGDGGPATEASLNRPWGVDTDADGNVYIADFYNHRIRRVTP